MDRFQNNYMTFYESVGTIVSPEFWKSKNPVLPEKNEDKIDFFVKNWYPHMKEVSNANLEYFTENKINPPIFQNLDFLDLFSQLNISNQNVVWEYLHSLYALSISNKYTQQKYNGDVSEMDEELLKSIKNSINSFPDFISNMVSWRRESKEPKNKESKNESNNETNNETKESNQKEPNFSENFMENSALAKLAKEISDEINPNEILNLGDDLKNMDNPMKLFQSILSGDKDNGVGKLMNTVCSKLKNKMESGEVNQDDLLKEATTLLQSMGGGKSHSNSSTGNGSNKTENKSGVPDLAGMMSMMQNLSSMGDLFGAGSGKSHEKGRKIRRRMSRKINKSNK